jgi:chromosomal replication initiation ATPase DnaA
MVTAADSLRRTQLAWRRGDIRRTVERLERADPEALAVISLVAGGCAVDVADLLGSTRCRAHIAAARQLAMYLINVKLGRTMTQIGALFGRDRTTVSYACRMIEDRREGTFEDDIERLELAIDLLETSAKPAEASRARAC